MLVKLPPSPVKSTLQSVFPGISPGLVWRLAGDWENASKADWANYPPLDGHEKAQVERHVRSFLEYIYGRRKGLVGADAARMEAIWLDAGAGLAPDSLDLRPAAGILAAEIQALLDSLGMSRLTRLLRAGADLLGMPPLLFWEGAAGHSPLTERVWARAWKLLDAKAPGLARPFASHLLTFLTAATVQAARESAWETPFTALSGIMLSGVCPISVAGSQRLLLLDIGTVTGR